MRSSIAALTLLLIAPAAASAQDERRAGDGCVGRYRMQMKWSALVEAPIEYPVLLDLPADQPLALAGIQAGDSLVARNGRDLLEGGERPPAQRRAPGDTIRWVVRRGARTIPITIIAGELRPGADGQLVCVAGPASAAEPAATPAASRAAP